MCRRDGAMQHTFKGSVECWGTLKGSVKCWGPKGSVECWGHDTHCRPLGETDPSLVSQLAGMPMPPPSFSTDGPCAPTKETDKMRQKGSQNNFARCLLKHMIHLAPTF